MLPTIETQLATIRTTLLAVAERVDGDDGAELADVARAVRIVERTWGRRLPVLAADIADLRDLLGADDPDPGAPCADLEAAEAAHEALRAKLAGMIAAAADDEAGHDLRRRATAALRTTSARQPW